MDKRSLLERYYSRLTALERRAPLTAETYRFEIKKFLEWLEAEKLSLKVDVSDVTRYLAHRRTADGIDSRSVAKAISALRSFSRFLEDEGPDNFSFFASLMQIPRRKDRLPEVYQKEEADLVLSMFNVETPLGLRNRALYELIYSAGLRVSEAIRLNTEDLFLSKRIARVIGKGSKERLVVYGDEAAFWVRRYMDEGRTEILGKRSAAVKALFVSRSGKRLSRKGVWKNYRAIAIQAGISTKLHTLRHTFATELLSGGADLRSVQELMGHAEITTTQIYTHIDSSHLRDSHRKYLPSLKAWRADEK